jgi:hypothetical protein
VAVLEEGTTATAERYAETRLVVGDGAAAVTEEEIREFVDEVITPRFPDGLTAGG